MSWTEVDFSLVRYSPVEGTHYFYDPAHPTAIQFLLSGRWESWDVGWVKYNAHDPDIKRIAADAEAQLLRAADSVYRPWPSTPPPRPPVGEPARSPQSAPSPLNSPLFEPASPTSAGDEYYLHLPPDDSPATPPHHRRRPSAPTSVLPAPPSRPPAYASPYRAQPTAPDPNIDPSLLPTPGPSQPTNPSPVSVHPPLQSNGSFHHPEPTPLAPPPPPPSSNGSAPQPDQTSQSPIQPGPPQPLLLSRNRETKILLSLDGDGIRGLSQLLLVESLVNAICVKVGTQVNPYQIFDLMGGASMGGLIALMLARMRMQAHRAREAYKLIAKEVFPNKRDFLSSVDPHAPPLTYDGQAVENAIKTVVTRETGYQEEALYDGRDDSADVFVVSTRIDIGTNKAALMRSYQTRRITGPELDANMTVWQAMKACAVAPRYMQPRTGVNWRPVIEPGLVDHGTAKNNPIRDILYECRKLYRYANDMMVIISIGTGSGFDPTRETPEMAKSVTDRVNEAQIWGDKFESDHSALMERGWMKYFRFNVPELNDVPLEEWCHEERIKEKTLAYLGRPDVGRAFYACVDAITSILVGAQR